MASLSKLTKFKRKKRDARKGQTRKKQARRFGTTPTFPIHTPEVDANAPAAQVSPAPCADSE